MRRIITAIVLAIAVLVGGASAVSADPDFGPGAGGGQGNNEPHEAGAKCHPPGQTVTEPGCK